MTAVAINGFGRIGRMVFRAMRGHPVLKVVAINDLADARTLAHLLRYDSVHGTLDVDVEAKGDHLLVAGEAVTVLSSRDPAGLPWRSLGVSVVVEATGLFTDRALAAQHLDAGAGRVVITAPVKEPDLTIVLGVNEEAYDPAKHRVISNASCTTNCLAPVAKILLETCGIRHGVMTTVHAYTNDQVLLDLPHRDLRRTRSAAVSMIPTTTGAAWAIGQVLPQLAGKLDGLAIRVPTPNVSIVDLVIEAERDTTVPALNAAFRRAADGPMKGILRYTEEPLVSVDFNGDPHSAIVDASLTKVLDGRMAKVIAWYDNEWGYACRVRDLVAYLARRESA